MNYQDKLDENIFWVEKIIKKFSFPEKIVLKIMLKFRVFNCSLIFNFLYISTKKIYFLYLKYINYAS